MPDERMRGAATRAARRAAATAGPRPGYECLLSLPGIGARSLGPCREGAVSGMFVASPSRGARG